MTQRPLARAWMQSAILFGALLALSAAGDASQESRPPPAASDALEHFEKYVRPVFVEHCVKCHGGEDPKGDLRLDTAEGIRDGAMGEPIAIAGDIEASTIALAISYEDPLLAMPPSGKLPGPAVRAIERWIELGANVPRDLNLDASDFVPWSLVPPRALPASLRGHPAGEGGGEPRDWIDVALEARLAEAGIERSPAASRESWLRRVTFDLTGLPPTPREWSAYGGTGGGYDARAAVVDRLLASPAYAERWARRWLDLVRYAETRAHEFDYSIPNAFQYRDYVIRAFDSDVPYDRFITEALAGDLVEEPRLDPTGTFDESVLGTGAWFLGEEVHSPVELRGDQCDRIAHQVEVLSKSVLAMGVACARCHDHKFDPISAEDYHGLAGFALSTAARQVRFETDGHNRDLAREVRAFLDGIQPAAADAVARALEAEAKGLAPVLTELMCAGPKGEARPPVSGARQLAWDALLRRDAEETAGSAISWCLHPPAQAPARTRAPEPPRILVEFGTLAGPTWIPNGPGFGIGPQPAGSIILDLAPGQDPGEAASVVVSTIAMEDSAIFHPMWKDLEVHPGTVTSRGGSFDWSQGGRTLLTPTFESEDGRIAYLARGQAKALLVVAGHKMVAGPLHRGVIQDIDTKGAWTWIEQDVATAADQRSHLELTAVGKGPFEIARVVDLAPDEPLPLGPLQEDWWSDALEAGDLDFRTPALRAAWLERAVADAAELLRTGGVSGRALSDGERAMLLRLADDLARHHPGVRGAIHKALRGMAEQLADLRSRRALVSGLAPAAIDLEGCDERILGRGSWRAPGAAAPRRAPSALRASHRALRLNGGGSGRLALARSLLGSPTKTLQRVWVNRLWKAMFTVGLVATPDDFGAMGVRPSHPEILDSLALDFERDGWSTKRILRRLALSNAYARSTAPTKSSLQRDPFNVLLSRMHVRRLEAEEVRDALLAVSGELDRTRFGPPVPVHLTDFMTGRGRPETSGPLDGAGRRSIYLEVRRNFPNPFLSVFDWPTPSTCRGKRSSSNVPAQALTLLNDPFVEGCAEHLAEFLLETADDGERTDALWVRVLGRPPEGNERTAWEDHLAGLDDTRAAWVDVAHVLFNVKDFLFLR